MSQLVIWSSGSCTRGRKSLLKNAQSSLLTTHQWPKSTVHHTRRRPSLSWPVGWRAQICTRHLYLFLNLYLESFVQRLLQGCNCARVGLSRALIFAPISQRWKGGTIRQRPLLFVPTTTLLSSTFCHVKEVLKSCDIYILKHAGGKVSLEASSVSRPNIFVAFFMYSFLNCPCQFLAIRAHLVCFCNCMWKLHYVSPGLLHCLPDLNLHLVIELSRGHVDC